ncbi:MAG: hypothetical protein KKG94_02775 [Nanoarchaeota archaeon]|nr:hypothetical protein [Nanoarchaeota archaeon]
MENETDRFWRYLLEKNKRYLEKQEIKENYAKFRKLWNQEDNFDKIFDSLRKNKILFLVKKKWSILAEEESSAVRKNKSMYNCIFFQKLFDYLNKNGISAYFGLGSAEYFKGNFWQTLHTFHIINNKYNLKKKVGNQAIIFVKFPKEIIIESAILKEFQKDGKSFSNNEKTLLDKIYYTEYMKGKANLFILDSLNYELINLYLGFFKKYPLVKAKLVTLLDEDQLRKIR